MAGMTTVPESASPWASLVLDQHPYFFDVLFNSGSIALQPSQTQ